MKRQSILVLAMAAVLATVSAWADPIPITSYDINSTFPAGYGGWHHTYDGTITNIGNDTDFHTNYDLYNYTNGNGTLNDGIVGSSEDDTHLFAFPVLPSLTIYFDDYSYINTIQLLSWGPEPSNEAAGSIAGVDITINGNTQYFNASGFGPWNSASAGRPAHGHIDISTSSLNDFLVNQVTFSNFITEHTPSFFGISEIIIDDEAVTLPPIIYPPIADAGGPYLLDIGTQDPIMLAGSVTGDYSQVAWDLNLDGLFDDAFDLNPLISSNMLTSLGFSPGNTWNIGLQVTGLYGEVDVSTTQLTFTPVPSAVILGSLGLTFSGWLLRKRRML
jgi:hypothetical protein